MINLTNIKNYLKNIKTNKSSLKINMTNKKNI